MDKMTMMLMGVDDLSEAELIEGSEGVASMAKKWVAEHGVPEVERYFQDWSTRFRLEAGSRRGANVPPAAPDFSYLADVKIEEIIEAHRFVKVVADASAGDALVGAVTDFLIVPLELLLIVRNAVEPDLPPTDEVLEA